MLSPVYEKMLTLGNDTVVIKTPPNNILTVLHIISKGRQREKQNILEKNMSKNVDFLPVDNDVPTGNFDARKDKTKNPPK